MGAHGESALPREESGPPSTSLSPLSHAQWKKPSISAVKLPALPPLPSEGPRGVSPGAGLQTAGGRGSKGSHPSTHITCLARREDVAPRAQAQDPDPFPSALPAALAHIPDQPANLSTVVLAADPLPKWEGPWDTLSLHHSPCSLRLSLHTVALPRDPPRTLGPHLPLDSHRSQCLQPLATYSLHSWSFHSSLAPQDQPV